MRQLTFTAPPIQHVGPKYSPDGSQLLYATDEDEEDPANQQDIWVMPAGGGAGTRLTRGINDRESRGWSPDGKRIVTQTVGNRRRTSLPPSPTKSIVTGTRCHFGS